MLLAIHWASRLSPDFSTPLLQQNVWGCADVFHSEGNFFQEVKDGRVDLLDHVYSCLWRKRVQQPLLEELGRLCRGVRLAAAGLCKKCLCFTYSYVFKMMFMVVLLMIAQMMLLVVVPVRCCSCFVRCCCQNAKLISSNVFPRTGFNNTHKGVRKQ